MIEEKKFSMRCNDDKRCLDFFVKGRCNYQHSLIHYERSNFIKMPFYERAFLIKETCNSVDAKHCKKIGCVFKHIDTLLHEFSKLEYSSRALIININEDYNRSETIIHCLKNLHSNPENSEQIISDFTKKYAFNKCDQIKKQRLNIISDLEKIMIKINLDYDTELTNIRNLFNKNLEIVKTEQELCQNLSILTVCEQNNATCSICFSQICEGSESNSNKAIKDDDVVFCVSCIKNMLKNANLYNVGKEKIYLPGIKCPFANIKKNHNHRIPVIAITIALAQAVPLNATTEIYDLISNITAKYHYEQTQEALRKKISSIEKEGVTSVSYIVQQIQNKILIDTCPNCQCAYEFIGGCQSVVCKDEYNGTGCGWNFCNVCLEYCDKYNDTHNHVAQCIQYHGLDRVGLYFLSTSEGHKWRMKHRCQRIRKFLDSQPSGINYAGILVVLCQNEKDLRPFLLDEFKDYSME